MTAYETIWRNHWKRHGLSDRCLDRMWDLYCVKVGDAKMVETVKREGLWPCS